MNSVRKGSIGGCRTILLVLTVLCSLLFSAAVYADEAHTVPEGEVEMHRLYNRSSGEHFYTGNTEEKEMLTGLGWRYEGVCWNAPAVSETPVYRVYNPNAGDHHYTMDLNEKNYLVRVGWNDEGIGWYSDDAKTAVLFRQYNPNAVAGAHNYTGNPEERDMLVSLGWKDEGLAWYGCRVNTEPYAAASKGVIVLDPGHTANPASGVEPLYPGSSEMKAKDNHGATGTTSGIYEYQMTLAFSKILRTELEARGYEVVMTREDHNTSPSCVERAQCANDIHADVFLRIHGDSFYSSAAYGASVMCTSPSNPAVAAMYPKNRALSDAIISNYCRATGLYNRGVVERDDLTGNNWCNVPCTLIELGYMSNPEDDLKITNSEFQITMAKGIADGIDAYMN
ncbi:MAG: N-acetylmuramoyl-L-alanine amidase [Eubacteriales bacterium]|nr:N-acetylmuramoyl-L-alanine amidase [Eubacteriales bacterium]